MSTRDGGSSATRDFRAEVAALEATLSDQRDVAVARLRAVHEAWARALIGIAATGKLVAQVRAAVEGGVAPESALEAIDQLHAAEQHQWEIGTWSTGSGEGLSSMFEVRTLQLAQAWLWTCATDAGAPDKSRALLDAVQDDPNDIAAPHRKDLRALRERLNTPSAIVSQFNACIGEGDLDALASLLADDHVFIDSAGTQISGKAAVVGAWRSFFAAFPGYRNELTTFVERGSEVCIEGHSHCSDPRLCGPALWRAVVRGGLLAEWRVLEDTPANRATLGLPERSADT